MSLLRGRAFDRVATLIAAVLVGVIVTACWINFANPRQVDFVSYWAAAQMALEGRSEAIYDIAAHRTVEMTAAPIGGLMPFAYPPPFLLFVVPIGLLPYGVAFAAWILATGLLYVAAASRSFRPAIALAHPGVLSNGLVGQNGFLTSAIFISGVRWIDDRPLLAGAILGLMVVKPQLGLLLPVALLAGGHWRVIAAAAASSSVLLGAAAAAFGLGAYAGFLRMLPVYADYMSAGAWPWNELASPFAFARYLGASATTAMAVHVAVAAAAAAMVWRAWRLGWTDRAAMLAAATVLIPPYLFSYDALLLVLPLATLIDRGRRRWLVPIVWGLSALPLAGNFGLLEAPNGLPVAAAIMLVAMYLDAVRPKSRASRDERSA